MPNDYKSAVILSTKNIINQKFSIVDAISNNIVLENNITDSLRSYGDFKFCYQIDFTSLNVYGNYKIKVNDIESYPFKIEKDLFSAIRDSLSLFFKVQRCGPTNPFLHKTCHLSDSYKLIGYKDSSSKDLTGGWHDAGDYIKFLKTTAYTTYMLLFSYEFDKNKFNYDLNKNEIPDILEEAKIGIDWLLRCNVNNESLVTQVQNKNDHNVGWRLPEEDSLQYFRPAYVSLSKNNIGYYTAVLALASKIWKEKFYDDQFANKCLSIAESFFKLRNSAIDFDTTVSSSYPDNDFNGKLALASIELYELTNKNEYLDLAFDYAEKAGSDYWWSVGQINSLAHFKISKYDKNYTKFIEQNLRHSINHSNKKTFSEALDYSWGTTNAFLGIVLQGILYKKLTNSTEFDSLIIFQRDYLLGRNPWGVSFIYNIGQNSVKNLHSQIAFFNGGYLPGGVSAGPAPKSLLNKYKILRSNFSTTAFNSDESEFYDDKNDYICNEPTISTNATALFVFGYYSN